MNISDLTPDFDPARVDETKTTPIVFEDKAIEYKNADIIEYDKEIRRVVEKSGMVYIRMFDLLNDSDLYDGLHPNKSGHEKMFIRVRDRIIKMIKV
ncbi:MAG: hypothetical protein A2Y24_02040 [Clostridiales bacterium GWE2_32_10]|nr:MAG: hypothetical protein A2Y24_02040 [Clostridiales bacterium GWE2_32_10]HBY20182.1 hypothetical protein [Clostridiales bacterium]